MKHLEKSALSVSAVAFFISDLIKNQLGSILIRGEISNLQLRQHSSYIRFSLKDEKAKIDCLTHSSSNAAKLLQHLQNGDEVIVFGQASYYTKYGQISFFTDEMMKLGEGIFASNLEQLKQKLYTEGLFDSSKKKPLPKYPSHIGIITSADGAALQDILRVARDRYPIIKITIFPSLVQGEHAPKSLYNALAAALIYSLDAIIIGRGGGSKEDLYAFNDENLVRLAASSKIPIISAVGHEIDTTLIDYIADVSAPTPTGAAMILFPDKNELLNSLQNNQELLNTSILNILHCEKQELLRLQEQLQISYKQYLLKQSQNIHLLSLKLSESHPQYILDKGYAVFVPGYTLKENENLEIITKDHILLTKIIQIQKRTPNE